VDRICIAHAERDEEGDASDASASPSTDRSMHAPSLRKFRFRSSSKKYIKIRYLSAQLNRPHHRLRPLEAETRCRRESTDSPRCDNQDAPNQLRVARSRQWSFGGNSDRLTNFSKVKFKSGLRRPTGPVQRFSASRDIALTWSGPKSTTLETGST